MVKNNSDNTTGEQEKADLTPIFANNDDDDDDDGQTFDFTDKVRCLHEKFDVDGDGYLNFVELYALQTATTDGNKLTADMYNMACKALDCIPNKGISLNALRLTYASDGANVEKDFQKVFSKKKKEKEEKAATKAVAEKETKKKDEEVIYEVGDDGVDISS